VASQYITAVILAFFSQEHQKCKKMNGIPQSMQDYLK